MRLIIDLPDAEENPSLQSLQEHHAIQIVRDALGEFIDARIPLDEYVQRRYPRENGYSNQFLHDKREEVSRRTTWAALIKCGTVTLEKP